MKKTLTLLLLCITILQSCKKEAKTDQKLPSRTTNATYEEIEIKYAEGFQIQNTDTGYYLTIMNPWPESVVTYPFKLIKNQERELIPEPDASLTIKIPIDKIVLTSTTHIPPLVLLKKEESLIGFPGSDYISDPKVRKL
ncbi:MAG: ABC transporter substrate-binding protein, partial [Nonlabens sp.]